MDTWGKKTGDRCQPIALCFHALDVRLGLGMKTLRCETHTTRRILP